MYLVAIEMYAILRRTLGAEKEQSSSSERMDMILRLEQAGFVGTLGHKGEDICGTAGWPIKNDESIEHSSSSALGESIIDTKTAFEILSPVLQIETDDHWEFSIARVLKKAEETLRSRCQRSNRQFHERNLCQ